MLHAALIAAPLLIQGVSTISNIFKSRKAKKAMKAQTAALNAQVQQGAMALRQQLSTTLGPAAAAYISGGGGNGQQGANTPSWA